MIDSVDICSRALMMLGCDSITSFDDETAESEISKCLYDTIKLSLLSCHPWRFAIKKQMLEKVEIDISHKELKNAFALPEKCLRVLASNPNVNYVINKRHLFTNGDYVEVDYITDTEESNMPLFFVELLVAKLAVEFCVALTESNSRVEFLRKKYEELLKKAKTLDFQ